MGAERPLRRRSGRPLRWYKALKKYHLVWIDRVSGFTSLEMGRGRKETQIFTL